MRAPLEKTAERLAEPFRTLLGHFRHEIGHYYWMYFAQSEAWLAAFRRHFGDDQQDYGAALNRYYANGPTSDWAASFVSAYATLHPWEDWAESWAHYLHMIDTLETAYSFGLTVDPRIGNRDHLTQTVRFDAYKQVDFDALITTWVPVTIAVNSLNRSMGEADLYPFVLTQPVIDKLTFIHNIIRQGSPR